MEVSAFAEITAVVGLAVAVGLVGTLLRQPLVVSFIAVGILAGPAGLGLVSHHEEMTLLAQMGISLLLFVVGLKLDLNIIRTMGPVALATGLGQVVFTSAFGFLIARALGIAPVGALYVAVALTFSSTIIIVKLLSDKGEIDSLHGRIAVGFLIVQDIVVVLVMIALSTFGGSGGGAESPAVGFAILAGRGLLFLAGFTVFMLYGLPRLLLLAARSPELLLLFSVAWAVVLAAAAEALGFSKEVGAFLAGVALASTPYREAIGSRLVTLRDFLLLFFFIQLGAGLDLSRLTEQLGSALIFSIFVLIGNPLIVMAIMGVMGYRKRTGFLAGLAVAQISEFSLILVGLGRSLGHVNEDVVALVTLVGLVTIGVSTYMIIYSGPLYASLARFLSVFERKVPYRELGGPPEAAMSGVDVILFGLGNYGWAILEHLQEHGKRVLGVDFDPEVVSRASSHGVTALYGDVGDPGLYEHLPLDQTPWALSALPDLDSNLTVVRSLRAHGYGGRIVVNARRQEDTTALEVSGAHLVLRPFTDAAEQAADALTTAIDTLTKATPWPVDVREVRLRPGSIFAGRTIAQVPLRAETGVSIMAVSRTGTSYFDPGPDFQLQVGDRLVLIGSREGLEQAADYLDQRQFGASESESTQFAVAEITVPEGSEWAGRTLSELDFRKRYGVTVIGIERKDQRISAPAATEILQPDDRLIVAGARQSLQACREACSMGG